MDNSQTRRGQPCWFRVPQVSWGSNYLFLGTKLFGYAIFMMAVSRAYLRRIRCWHRLSNIVHLLKIDFHAACFYLISSYKQLIFMPISVWFPHRDGFILVSLSVNCFRLFSLQTLTPIAGLLFAGWPHCCKWRDYPSQSYFTDPSTPLQRKALLCWSHWFVQWGNTIFWHKHRFMQNLLNSSKQWLTLFLHL